MAERYWFKPAHIGQNVVANPQTPVLGQPGTVGSKRAIIVTPVHPDAPDGGLAGAAAEQEPAPLRSGPNALIAAGPQAPLEFRQVYQPQFVARGAATVPVNTTPVTTILVQPTGTGIIRAIHLFAGDVAMSAAAVLNAYLQSSYGEIYFAEQPLLGTTAFTGALLGFTNLYVPFKNGLNLVLQTANVGANTGSISANVIWEL